MSAFYTRFQRWLLSPAGLPFARCIAGATLATLHNAERIPREGSVLVVSNHAFLGLDTPALGALLILHTGRAPFFLADRNVFRYVRSLIASLGGIPGTREGATGLLSRGELVVVYPGGVDDAFKLTSEAYTLKWGDRQGFARVAIESKAPIVPIAATGIDEVFELHRREHIVGRRVGGCPRYDIPLPEPRMPRRVPFNYYVRPPIDTSGPAEDAGHVDRVRLAVHESLEAVLAPYRARMKRLLSPPQDH
jgi:1-acyl-sn-glycerol-3-phosphate acyltransferase